MALQRFQFVERTRPVGAEQARKTAVGEHFAASLALRAIVGFVISVTNAQDLLTAARTWLAVFAVNRHLGAERGDFLGKFLGGFGGEAINPDLQRGARGVVEALPFVGL